MIILVLTLVILFQKLLMPLHHIHMTSLLYDIPCVTTSWPMTVRNHRIYSRWNSCQFLLEFVIKSLFFNKWGYVINRKQNMCAFWKEISHSWLSWPGKRPRTMVSCSFGAKKARYFHLKCTLMQFSYATEFKLTSNLIEKVLVRQPYAFLLLLKHKNKHNQFYCQFTLFHDE